MKKWRRVIRVVGYLEKACDRSRLIDCGRCSQRRRLVGMRRVGVGRGVLGHLGERNGERVVLADKDLRGLSQHRRSGKPPERSNEREKETERKRDRETEPTT